MSEPAKAVFVSYASQDADAARRICDALRALGLEVWFDQSELRGGEAWDASIRHQIKECALFVPVISASTNARSEGYFRLEWKLAVDRSHLMADDQAFLLPVLIDDISEAAARVPDRFRERQWWRLLAGDSTAALAERVRQLLCGATAPASSALPTGGQLAMPVVTPPADAIADSGMSRLSKLIAKRKRLWGAIAAIATIAVALSGLAVYRNTYRTVNKAVATVADRTAARADSNPLSLAILPFTNATGDPNLAYIAEGLTASLSASLTTDLAATEDAFVTPAAITAAYKAKAAPAQQLGKDSEVHFVLQGNVQRAGSKIRFTADLVQASTGTQLWSETYDGDQSDLLALQDKVKKNQDFESKMFIAAARNSEIRMGTPTAADYYVRGYALEFGDGSLKTKQQEVGLFRQMLALEPNNSKAMICVASALTDVATASYGQELDKDETEHYFEEGRALALRARVLGSNNPWVYEVLAVYAQYHDDYPGWLENSKAWQQTLPTNLVSYIYIADAYLSGGDPNKAITLLQQALDMDRSPPEWGELRYLGKAHFMLGDNAGAVEILQRARTVNPSSATIYAYLAMASVSMGDESAARTAALELRRQRPKFTFRTFERLEKPMQSCPPAYKIWWTTKLIPAWRKAGLPE
jgi:TolB-like protein/tetratricopeptide (TPR) repeat protein